MGRTAVLPTKDRLYFNFKCFGPTQITNLSNKIRFSTHASSILCGKEGTIRSDPAAYMLVNVPRAKNP
jgi:hypothetical protein